MSQHIILSRILLWLPEKIGILTKSKKKLGHTEAAQINRITKQVYILLHSASHFKFIVGCHRYCDTFMTTDTAARELAP